MRFEGEASVKNKPLAAGISVSPQLSPSDIVAAKNAGIRTIINSRPDEEEPAQPKSAELEREAKAAGLEYRHIPVVPGQLTDKDVDAFCDAMSGCDKPVLAFCKSGMRATSLWALSQAGKMPTQEIIGQAADCGYDVTPLKSRIDERARKARA
jgi:sulfide:quinone oxidoreductase